MKKIKKGLLAALACIIMLGGPTIDTSAACSHSGQVYSTLVSTDKVMKQCSKHGTVCSFTVRKYNVYCSNCGGYVRTTTTTTHN